MRLGTLTHIALAVVAVTGGLLHMVGWGFYLTDPWKRALWIGLTIFWVGLLLYMRIVKPLFMLRAPRSLGDRFCLAEIVLLAMRIRPHIPGWYQPRAVANRHESSAQVMRPTHASMQIRHGGILARRA